MKIKTPHSLSQDVTIHQTNAFTITLSYLQRRVCTAWEPSNNKMLFLPPEIKLLSTSSPSFSLCSYSYTILPNSLPLQMVYRLHDRTFLRATSIFWTEV